MEKYCGKCGDEMDADSKSPICYWCEVLEEDV